MEEARNLTKAERCSLFLVDHDAGELIAKVFDGIESEVNVFFNFFFFAFFNSFKARMYIFLFSILL